MNLILLHGFCESSAIWGNMLPHLEEHVFVHCLDLPGFGKNSNTALSIEEMAEDVHRQIEHLDLDSYYIIGHSMGGYVALRYAQMFSEKLIGLGLFHSTPFPDSEEKKQIREKSIRFIKNYGGQIYLSTFVPGLFWEQNLNQMQSFIFTLLNDGSTISDASIISSLIAMKNRVSSVEFVKDTKLPILYIFGKRDEFVSMDENLKLVSETSNSDIGIMQNVAHMGMYEDYVTSARIINDFLLGSKKNFIKNKV